MKPFLQVGCAFLVMSIAVAPGGIQERRFVGTLTALDRKLCAKGDAVFLIKPGLAETCRSVWNVPVPASPFQNELLIAGVGDEEAPVKRSLTIDHTGSTTEVRLWQIPGPTPVNGDYTRWTLEVASNTERTQAADSQRNSGSSEPPADPLYRFRVAHGKYQDWYLTAEPFIGKPDQQRSNSQYPFPQRLKVTPEAKSALLVKRGQTLTLSEDFGIVYLISPGEESIPTWTTWSLSAPTIKVQNGWAIHPRKENTQTEDARKSPQRWSLRGNTPPSPLYLSVDLTGETPQIRVASELNDNSRWMMEVVSRITPQPFGKLHRGQSGYAFRIRVAEGQYKGWYLAVENKTQDPKTPNTDENEPRRLTLVQDVKSSLVLKYIEEEFSTRHK